MTTPALTDHPAAGLGEPVIPARDHQPDLLAQVVAELQPAPGRPIPPDGLRVTLAAAPGTGKTWISREAARQLAPNRRVLVMAHTVDLLIQTIAWWRKAGHTEPAIAFFEAKGNDELKQLGVRATTSAPRLALWGGSGPVTVFATYASIAPRREGERKVPGPLEEAFAGTCGLRLDPFDLAVFDEAHRTAGALDKAWGAVHDNTRIPADRRLYMTATPRLFSLAGGDEGEAGQLVASMDDEAIYGKHVVFGLLEGIERGVIGRFEIHVLEVRDPAAESGLSDEAAQERRLAALQAALLTQWKQADIRSVLTFHNLTRDAMRFARGLHATADDLYESDPGRYPDPVHVSAEWLSGEHDPGHRREVVRQFADGLDHQGNTTEMSFLASCRVLGEGIDITGRRGVEAVVFADVRGSVVDVVQNVGRALRQQPGEGKIAPIIVPIFLAPDEDPQDMLTSPAYRPLVAILQALSAYEGKIAERLVLRQQATGRGKADEVLVDDPLYVREAGRSGTAQQDEDGDGQDDAEEEGNDDKMPGDGPLLRFFTPRDSVTVARFLRSRVLQPESEVWLTGYQHLCRWVEEHQDADEPSRVPQKEVVPLRRSRGGRGRAAGAAGSSSGAEGGEMEGYPLGRWRTEQLRAHSNGTLKAWRFQLLDELGMVWDGADARFEEKIAVYRRYVARHHTLAAPLNAVFEGVPVGRDLANLRRPGGLGKKVERAARRQALLEAVDPDWRPDWPLVWQRCWAKVRWCVEEAGAELAELQPGVVVDGEDLGAWIAEQQHSWGALSPAQRDRLNGLGIQAPAGALTGPRLALEAGTADGGGQAAGATAAPEAASDVGAGSGTGAGAAGPVTLPYTASTWEKNMAALRQYQQREGHVRVPRTHREVIHIDHRADSGEIADAADSEADAGQVREEHVRLGVFRSNTRARRDKLTPAQRREAEAIGLL